MKNYYALLNIDPVCSPGEIKAAYRKLAKKSHPDRGGDPCLFRDIQEAYETLSNPDRRREYDSERSRRPFFGERYRTVTPVVSHRPVDVFDDLVDVFSQRFGFGSDTGLDVDIVLSAREAATGVNLELAVPIEKICDACFGFGGTILSGCPYCGGKGILSGVGRAYVRIRPGVKSGEMVVSQTGDLIIRGRIVIEP